MKKTLTSYGYASSQAEPDLMQIRFTIKENDQIYSDALERLRKMQIEILRLFNEHGFDSAKLRTSSIDIHYDDQEHSYELRQFYLYCGPIEMDRISSLIESLDKDSHFDLLLTYDLSNKEKVLEEALILALKDAKRQAEIMAREMNLELLEAIQIEEMPSAPVHFRTAQFSAIEAASLDFSKEVKVLWRIN